MQNLPLINYGFTYKCNDRNYSFVIPAHNQQEARERAKAMSMAQLVGPLECGPQEWALPAGSLVHIRGLPYALVADTKVAGFHDPESTTEEPNTGVGGAKVLAA